MQALDCNLEVCTEKSQFSEKFSDSIKNFEPEPSSSKHSNNNNNDNSNSSSSNSKAAGARSCSQQYPHSP